MIFLPNFFERYTAALRKTVHISILKYGPKLKHFDNLRKIFIAEACYLAREEIPLNIGDFSSRILVSCYIKKLDNNAPFEFSINLNRNFMVNPKLFAALLLTLCKSSKSIWITTFNGKVILKSENNHSEYPYILKRLVKALNGRLLYEIKTQKIMIILPFSATQKKPEEFIPCYHNLCDPFSAINIFWNSTF